MASDRWRASNRMDSNQETESFLDSRVSQNSNLQPTFRIPRKQLSTGHHSLSPNNNIQPRQAAYQKLQYTGPQPDTATPQHQFTPNLSPGAYEAYARRNPYVEDRRSRNDTEQRTSEQREVPSHELQTESYTEEPTLEKPLVKAESNHNWKPKSLRTIELLVLFLIVHCTIYLIAGPVRGYDRNQFKVFTKVSSANSWFFQFAPSFVAVFIKEWCSRLDIDYQTIAPHLKPSLANQKAGLFGRQKLYSVGFWRSVTTQTRFSILSHLASILIIIQCTVLVKQNTLVYENTPIIKAAPQAFIDTFPNSRLPALAVPSYYTNQTTDPIWFETLLELNYGGTFWATIGLLPYQSEVPVDTMHSITANTSGFASVLYCTQVDRAVVRMRSSGNQTWDVHVDLLDDQGCGFNNTYGQVRLVDQTNTIDSAMRLNGAVGNNTFAMWSRFGSALNSYITTGNRSVCIDNKQFLISGQVDNTSLPTSNGTWTQVEASDKYGWAAVSCTTSYLVLDDVLHFTVNPNGSTMVNQPNSKDVTLIQQPDLFDEAMRRNFLDTGVVWNLSNIFTGETFWSTETNQVWPNSYTQNTATVIERMCGNSTSGTLPKSFSSPIACRMYANAMNIWQVAFALSVPLTSSFWPANLWTHSKGTVSKFEPGWAVARVPVLLSIVIQVLMIILLLLSGMLHGSVGRRGPRRFRNVKTGLKYNPSYIAVKAMIFRKPEIRQILTGVDALVGEEAERIIRHRVSTIQRFVMRANRPAGALDSTVTESPYIDFVDEDLQNTHSHELQNIRDLPRDDHVLSTIRFAFSSWTVHWASLLFVFLLTCFAIAGGVYTTTQDQGYYFWKISWITRGDFDLEDSTRVVGQVALFSILPVLILLFFRWWWTCIDSFFRHSQPYVGLYHSTIGARSVCLSYISDMDIFVSLKAYRNRDYRLAFVTINTFLIKIALALAGGLFVISEGIPNRSRPFPLLQTWQNNTFAMSSQSFEINSLRSVIVHANKNLNLKSIYDGWQTDLYSIPAINMDGANGKYRLTVPALSADLECQEAKVDFTKQSENGPLTAQLQSDVCSQAEWPSYCYLNKDGDPEDGTRQFLLLPFLSTSTESSTTTSTTSKTAPSTSRATSSVSGSRKLGPTDTIITTGSTSARTMPSSASRAPSTIGTIVTTGSTSVRTMLSSESRAPSTVGTIITTGATSARSMTASVLTVSRSAVSPPAPTRSGTTSECFKWYTPQPGEYCWEIAQQLKIDWELMRGLNSDIDMGCSNLQIGISYCVDGVLQGGSVKRQLNTNGTGFGNTSQGFVLSNNPGSCTGWRYIEPTACGDNSGSAGHWWILNAYGTAYNMSRSANVTGLYNVSQHSSLLCKPQYYNNVLDITVYAWDNAASLNLTVNRVVSSEKLPENAWASSKYDQTITFGNYFSTSLKQYKFVDAYTPLTDTIFLDGMSIVAAASSNQSITSLQSLPEFMNSASSAFGRTFAQVVSHKISADGTTFLMRPVQAGEILPTISGYMSIGTAKASTVPLYATIVALTIYAVALWFVYPDKSRRTALDPSVPMNVVASVYDSSIMNLVQSSIDQGRNPLEDLKDQHFAYGVYQGVSTGKRRLGIDIADRVEPVHDPADDNNLSQKLRRRWGRNHPEDEAGPPELQQHYTDGPAPVTSELPNTNVYEVQQVYTRDHYRTNHGQAVETAYSSMLPPGDIYDSGGSSHSSREARWLPLLRSKKKSQPNVRIRQVNYERVGYSSPSPARQPGLVGYFKDLWKRR